MKRLLLATTITILYFSCVSAQTADQFNSWYMYFGNHKLSEKVGLHTEYQFRRHGLIKDWQQSLARIGIDYHVNKSTITTAGYGWIVSYPYGDQPSATYSNEHRIWQQLILKQKSGIVSFQHRYRLEQRFLENAMLTHSDERVTDGFRFRQRFRYRALVSVPLSMNASGDKGLFFAAYEEIFLGFGEGIGPNVLDQNRLFAALGWKFSKSTNVQVGYLFHRVFKSDGLSRENNHTFQAALTHNFDFSGVGKE